MAVRIRMKRHGRRHRPFFRVCAVDARAARDGKVIEELGYYDPMVRDVDARAILKGERIEYWLSVGAQPSPKVRVLIKKYGAQGTHLEQQKGALERTKTSRPMPLAAGPPQTEVVDASPPQTDTAPPQTEVVEPQTDTAPPKTEVDTSPPSEPPAHEPSESQQPPTSPEAGDVPPLPLGEGQGEGSG